LTRPILLDKWSGDAAREPQELAERTRIKRAAARHRCAMERGARGGLPHYL
jgi:hypothetical protein